MSKTLLGLSTLTKRSSIKEVDFDLDSLSPKQQFSSTLKKPSKKLSEPFAEESPRIRKLKLMNIDVQELLDKNNASMKKLK